MRSETKKSIYVQYLTKSYIFKAEVFLKIEILVHEAQRKIDEQTNLTAGMSPSGHLPCKMDSPAS